jgi:hypothetical protein
MKKIGVIWGQWKVVFWILLLVWLGAFVFPLLKDPSQINNETNIFTASVLSLIAILIRAISKEE